MTIDLDAARVFVYTNGRLLDRRLVATVLDGAPGGGVIDALRGYRNDDGGFGHGLEPDKRDPSSTPLDTETAFEAMEMAGTVDVALVAAACDWLASVAEGTGMVPLAFATLVEYPHAEHWSQIPLVADINPTGGLAAFLWKWGIDHPWREVATAACWQALDNEIPREAHAVKEAMRFLAAQPDRGRATAILPSIAAVFDDVALLQQRPSADYGVGPLHLVPERDGFGASLFSNATYEAFLDDLEARQQDDGGWPIAWNPPGPAAAHEWRSWVTLQALMTLRAWGRLPR